MKMLGLMLLLGAAHLGFGQTNVVTFTNRNGKVYQDVIITEVTKDWLTWAPARGIGMGRVRLADLPDDQQRRFGYDAAQGAERDIEAALGAGLFRELDGMVYDLRKPQAEWMLFYGAWLAGQGQDGAFIVPKPSDLAIRDRAHGRDRGRQDPQRGALGCRFQPDRYSDLRPASQAHGRIPELLGQAQRHDTRFPGP